MKATFRIIAGFCFFSAVAIASPAQAATFTVDTFVDSNALAQQACTAAPNDCSLRGAILKANGLAGLDTVRIPSGVYPLTIVGGDNTGNLGDLDITDSVNLVGLGIGARINAAGIPSESVLEIPAGSAPTVDLQKLAFTGGTNSGIRVGGGGVTARYCVFEGNSFASSPGGAIDNSSVLTLRDSFVRNNSSGGDGGGIYNATAGQLTLVNTLVSLNSTTASGGGISNYGTATLMASGVRNNSATSALSVGGGLRNLGQMTIIDANIADNVVNGTFNLGGGGIFNSTANGNLIIIGGSVTGNSAPSGYGGGINNTESVQFQVFNTLISDNEATRGAGIYSGDDAVLNGVEVSSNISSGDGGGIVGGGNGAAISIVDATVDGNSAVGNGGGVNLSGGDFSISQSTIMNNTAQGFGGGIYQLDNSTGKLKIDNSTIVGNQATSAGSEGGGIFNYTSDLLLDHVLVDGNTAGLSGGGIKHTDGAMTVLASAIVDNEAGNNGGGIDQDYDGSNTTSSYTNVTISGNLAAVDGGGIYNSQDGGVADIYLFNTTIADNDALASLSDGVYLAGGVMTSRNSIIGAQVTFGADCLLTLGAVINAPGNNLESAATCGFSMGGGIVLGLDVLANNGGFTPTHALLPISPALNAGPALGCPGDGDGNGTPDYIQATDQRDQPRGAPCDLGAFEL